MHIDAFLDKEMMQQPTDVPGLAAAAAENPNTVDQQQHQEEVQPAVAIAASSLSSSSGRSVVELQESCLLLQQKLEIIKQTKEAVIQEQLALSKLPASIMTKTHPDTDEQTSRLDVMAAAEAATVGGGGGGEATTAAELLVVGMLLSHCIVV